MSFVIKKNRKVVIEHKDGDVELSLTFDFPVAEDRDAAKLRSKLRNIDGEDNGTLAMLYLMRTALVACSGIQFENDDGTFATPDMKNEIDQKLVFNSVWMIEAIRNKILTAYTGIEGKNLKSGATQ